MRCRRTSGGIADGLFDGGIGDGFHAPTITRMKMRRREGRAGGKGRAIRGSAPPPGAMRPGGASLFLRPAGPAPAAGPDSGRTPGAAALGLTRRPAVSRACAAARPDAANAIG